MRIFVSKQKIGGSKNLLKIHMVHPVSVLSTLMILQTEKVTRWRALCLKLVKYHPFFLPRTFPKTISKSYGKFFLAHTIKFRNSRDYYSKYIYFLSVDVILSIPLRLPQLRSSAWALQAFRNIKPQRQHKLFVLKLVILPQRSAAELRITAMQTRGDVLWSCWRK